MKEEVRNIRLMLQYEGTRYQGWQRQEKNGNTIQEKLEGILSRMCGEPVELQGSGRTDAGVHAKGQVANFHTHSSMSADEMKKYINTYLPQDIAVTDVAEASARFHSRLNAVGKCYRYLVWNSDTPDVFLRRYAMDYPAALDVLRMNEAASFLTGEHDFKAFTSTKKGKKPTVRRIDEISITKEGNLVTFTFCGSGFLYHMVRILVGTLLEVGEGKRPVDSMPALIASGKRELAGPLAQARGLILEKVFYF